MSKKSKGAIALELLKQGLGPAEIAKRTSVSYNYAWKLKKDLEAAAKEVVGAIGATAIGFVPSKPKPGEFVEADTNVDAILNARATTYGRFVNVALFAQEMKGMIRSALDEQNANLQADHQEALDMITSKIARIINGDPNYVDNWSDIAGYATLVAERLQGKSR